MKYTKIYSETELFKIITFCDEYLDEINFFESVYNRRYLIFEAIYQSYLGYFPKTLLKKKLKITKLGNYDSSIVKQLKIKIREKSTERIASLSKAREELKDIESAIKMNAITSKDCISDYSGGNIIDYTINQADIFFNTEISYAEADSVRDKCRKEPLPRIRASISAVCRKVDKNISIESLGRAFGINHTNFTNYSKKYHKWEESNPRLKLFRMLTTESINKYRTKDEQPKVSA